MNKSLIRLILCMPIFFLMNPNSLLHSEVNIFSSFMEEFYQISPCLLADNGTPYAVGESPFDVQKVSSNSNSSNTTIQGRCTINNQNEKLRTPLPILCGATGQLDTGYIEVNIKGNFQSSNSPQEYMAYDITALLKYRLNGGNDSIEIVNNPVLPGTNLNLFDATVIDDSIAEDRYFDINLSARRLAIGFHEVSFEYYTDLANTIPFEFNINGRVTNRVSTFLEVEEADYSGGFIMYRNDITPELELDVVYGNNYMVSDLDAFYASGFDIVYYDNIDSALICSPNNQLASTSTFTALADRRIYAKISTGQAELPDMGCFIVEEIKINAISATPNTNCSLIGTQDGDFPGFESLNPFNTQRLETGDTAITVGFFGIDNRNNTNNPCDIANNGQFLNVPIFNDCGIGTVEEGFIILTVEGVFGVQGTASAIAMGGVRYTSETDRGVVIKFNTLRQEYEVVRGRPQSLFVDNFDLPNRLTSIDDRFIQLEFNNPYISLGFHNVTLEYYENWREPMGTEPILGVPSNPIVFEDIDGNMTNTAQITFEVQSDNPANQIYNNLDEEKLFVSCLPSVPTKSELDLDTRFNDYLASRFNLNNIDTILFYSSFDSALVRSPNLAFDPQMDLVEKYYLHIITAGGCVVFDSINIDNVDQVAFIPIDAEICASDSVVVDDFTQGSAFRWMRNGAVIMDSIRSSFIIREAGNYHGIAINSFGCDSANIFVNVTTLDTSNIVDVVTACDSYTWTDGNTYTSSNNTATQVFTKPNGCDSLITLDLTILESTSATHSIIACESFEWIDGNTYTSSTNTAMHTIPNSVGCDSIVTLNVTILNATTATDMVFACGSFEWIDGNTYTSSTNTPIHIIPNSVGCDSIVTLDLTILPFPEVPIISGDNSFCGGEVVTLDASTSFGSGFRYQWYRGTDAIAGQTSSSIMVSSGGTYRIEVTNLNGCTSSSEPYLVTEFANPSIDDIEGALTYCNNGTTTLNIVSDNTDGVTFSWAIFANGEFETVSIGNSQTIDLPIQDKGDVYYAIARNTDGCEVVYGPIQLTSVDCRLICVENILVSLGECNYTVTADNILESTPLLDSEYQIELRYSDGTLIENNTLSNLDVNRRIEYRISNIYTDSFCDGEITVEDKQVFQINCTADTLFCTDPALITPDSLYTQYIPSYDDLGCFTVDSVKVLDVVFRDGGCRDLWSGGIYERLIEVTNTIGQKATCRQDLYILTPMFSDFSKPEDVKGFDCSDPALDGIDFDNLDAEGTALFITPEIVAELAGKEAQSPNFGGYPLSDDFSKCNLTYTYEDLTFNACNGKKIIRTWTLTNFCSGVSREYEQILLLADLQAPTLKENVTNITVNVSSLNCTGEVNISELFEDGCSEIVNIRARYLFSNGALEGGNEIIVDALNNNIAGLAVDMTHSIYATATDECGNTSDEYEILVTVEDNRDPIAIANRQLNVTLGTDGIGTITPELLDEGSFDACGIQSYEIRRLASDCQARSEWTTGEVEFYCCEVGTTVDVELRVTDGDGNSAVAVGQVLVEDGVPLTISCVNDLSISCDEDLDLFSSMSYLSPELLTGCENVDTFFSVTNNVECGSGTIIREWTFSRSNTENQTATCSQIINVSPSNNWTARFPEDKTISCLDNLTGTESVIVENFGCEEILITSDTVLEPTLNGECQRYRIDFELINSCVNQALDGSTSDDIDLGNRVIQSGVDGYIAYSQFITIMDNDAPIIDCSTDIDTFRFTNDDCQTAVTVQVSASDQCDNELLTYQSSIDINNNGIFFEIVDANSNIAEVTAVLGEGEYQANFIVVDACGNESTCTKTFVVKDEKAPSPTCFAGLTSVIMPESGQVSIAATNFLLNAMDNCTSEDSLLANTEIRVPIDGFDFWTDTLFVDCDLIRSLGVFIPIEVRVTDQTGNTGVCNTGVVVRDNNNDCPQSTTATLANVAGIITNDAGYEIPNVEVILNEENRFNTAEKGGFAFSDLTKGEAYKIEAFKNDDILNGVNVSDVIAMNQHILGIKPFENPSQMLAADVDKNNRISVSDILSVRQLILGITDSFTNNNSWRFIDAAYQFENTANALKENYSEFITINSLNTNDGTLDFVGIKVGDVTGNATVTNSILESRSGQVVGLNIKDATLNVGQEYEMVVTAANYNEVLGQQFSVDFDADALDIIDIKGNEWDVTASNFNLDNISTGSLSALHATTEAITYELGEALFTIRLRAKEVVRLSEVITLSNSLTESVAYVSEAGETLAANINLTFEGEQIATAFNLHQNRPNPFNGETIIGFDLPISGSATLRIFDVDGKTLYQQKGDFARGYNEIVIQANKLTQAGILYYELRTENHSAVKKMVISK